MCGTHDISDKKDKAYYELETRICFRHLFRELPKYNALFEFVLDIFTLSKIWNLHVV